MTVATPYYISVKILAELYQLVATEADARGMPMNEVIALALADHYRRPDLGVVPRRGVGGRPRQKARPPAAN